LRKVESLWRDVGARLLRTTPEAHDEFVSRSSHLPHLLAATLANLVLDPKLPKEQAVLCATGFRDTTRIASGSPEMWRDIALTNRKYLGRTVGGLWRTWKNFKPLSNAAMPGPSRSILKPQSSGATNGACAESRPRRNRLSKLNHL
jgi:prephenate dehydrogenase